MGGAMYQLMKATPIAEDSAVGGYMVDIAGRNDDTVVVVHPFLRAAQVGSRIQVVHFARRDTQRAHSDESDAVVGRMHAGGFTVILNDDGRFGLGIVESGGFGGVCVVITEILSSAGVSVR